MSAGYYDDNDGRGTYNSIKIKARLEGRQDYARIAALIFAILGVFAIAGSLAAVGLPDFPRLALFNSGLCFFVWAGIMVIGWGATSGHLAVYRLIEHKAEENADRIDTAIDLEKKTSTIVGEVLRDDLARKRESRGG